ncbi:MAG: acyl-CoA synthetase FdrA [Cytophagales bacterium]|nr:acyl-CoA synthetase FdrA [Cytophagales bacterium]
MSTPTSQALFTQAFVHANLYKDSVALMRVAQALLALDGVVNATLQMGNPANKEILTEAGLLTAEVQSAGPSDVMVVVQATSSKACASAIDAAKVQLAGQGKVASGTAQEEIAPRTVSMGLAKLSAANIVQISVPGAYAAAEALKAVKQGLNVFMFSDNVPLAQEIAIKTEAKKRGVLVMGPDCGTAIIGGVPLGFANNVRRGNIGLVAASGTGLQEVTTQIHRMSGGEGRRRTVGVSHAIGTGGRDVYADVGGITMLQGIELLADDAATQVIAIVAKPPAPEVTQKVLAALERAGKPAVVLFLGSDLKSPSKSIKLVQTMVDCAAQAVRLAEKFSPRVPSAALSRGADGLSSYPIPRKPKFSQASRYLRALYSGGTYCSEAQMIWAQAGLSVWSNIPVNQALLLPHPKKASFEHTALDLGDDDFTVGKPHPMIDQGARIERLLREAADPSVRVIVLDVVIGWGAHADPASELAAAIVQAKHIAAKDKRALAVLGFVCGTDQDPQGFAAQEKKLQDAGMVLAPNSASAAWLAAQWLQ